ncbi:hypothetical protein BJY01DRAFT_250657 [Aspergillus pseudoustus]|uniref:Uncharacterized protein n=1 Tax=Aspergillus pseudoustus TaxID=1810923 RepID=A0ABR4JGE7_9EURO
MDTSAQKSSELTAAIWANDLSVVLTLLGTDIPTLGMADALKAAVMSKDQRVTFTQTLTEDLMRTKQAEMASYALELSAAENSVVVTGRLYHNRRSVLEGCLDELLSAYGPKELTTLKRETCELFATILPVYHQCIVEDHVLIASGKQCPLYRAIPARCYDFVPRASCARMLCPQLPALMRQPILQRLASTRRGNDVARRVLFSLRGKMCPVAEEIVDYWMPYHKTMTGPTGEEVILVNESLPDLQLKRITYFMCGWDWTAVGGALTGAVACERLAEAATVFGLHELAALAKSHCR